MKIKSLEGILTEVKEQRDDYENQVTKMKSTMESNEIVHSAEKKELLERLSDVEKKVSKKIFRIAMRTFIYHSPFSFYVVGVI